MFTIIDLSHSLSARTPAWPGTPPPDLETVVDYEAGACVQRLHSVLGLGTHVDAPAHIIRGGRTIEGIAADRLTGPAIVVDTGTRSDLDLIIGLDAITEWERLHGVIPPASIVLIRTGWSRHWHTPGYFCGQGGELRFPGLDTAAARYLVRRRPRLIGIDGPSLDHSGSLAMDAHRIILGADIPQIENLTALEQLPPTGATVSVGVISITHATEAPARVVAWVSTDTMRPVT